MASGESLESLLDSFIEDVGYFQDYISSKCVNTMELSHRQFPIPTTSYLSECSRSVVHQCLHTKLQGMIFLPADPICCGALWVSAVHLQGKSDKAEPKMYNTHMHSDET